MEHVTTFGDILEAADRLSVEEQESLLDVLRRRLVERRRQDVAQDIEEARGAWEAGQCREVTPDEIYDEIVS